MPRREKPDRRLSAVLVTGLVTGLVAGLLACAGGCDSGGGGADAGTSPTDAATDGGLAGSDASSSTTTDGATALGSDSFPQSAPWYQSVSASDTAADSAAIIAHLEASGWGTLGIDVSFAVLHADASVARRAYTPNNAFYYEPDCDLAPVPLPPGGAIENYPQNGYACGGGDCHLIVWAPATDRLYEMWRANIVGTDTFYGGCLAVWDTSRIYGTNGRGQQCSSADAAGFPIAPPLFTADEVAAGEIDHAIRFILPNDRVREGYVPPATHGTRTTGVGGSPFYGVHFRLRRDYDLASLPSDGARVVARALQHYGMFHADGGNIALTAASDRRTTAKWDGLLAPRDLSMLEVEDFDVIDHGASIALTFDCMR